MGRVSAPFGVKGWVKVQPFTEKTDSLCQYPAWSLRRDGDWESFSVAEQAVHGSVLVVRFAGVDDREQAAALKGRDVGIPRAQLPALAEGEYYWTDLIGLVVENKAGQILGRIEKLLESGANPVLVVAGERERLIPFVDAVVRHVYLEAGKVLVDWELDY